MGQASGTSGDACAITLWQVDQWLRQQDISVLAQWSVSAAGDSALAAWGWVLADDPEAGRHWRPRARGVRVDDEPGFFFSGRRAALEEIVCWMAEPRTRQALVVTGSPGVGKSAVLGRVVTTSDSGIRVALPENDTGVRAPVGSVACAVHVKGKTAPEVAIELARAASVALPEEPEQLAPLLREALTRGRLRGGTGSPVTVVLDALDEAASPHQARAVIRDIVLPLVEMCAEAGLRVVVGTRRQDSAGDLLAPFGSAARILDLDASEFFDDRDLADYVRATLLAAASGRPGSPYRDPATAAAAAARIAALAERNFLVAGLAARSHALRDDAAADSATLWFVPTVEASLREYIGSLPSAGPVPPGEVLTALAYAEAPGFSLELWALAVRALTGRAPTGDQLRAFVDDAPVGYLMESPDGSGEQHTGHYQLFHQALNDTLIAARADTATPEEDHRALARAFAAAGRTAGWDVAPDYLLTSLPGHAARGGVLDELLLDDDFLLHADLRRLVPLADMFATEAARTRARLLRKTPRAITASPALRAALFSVTEAQGAMGTAFRDSPARSPYRAVWADDMTGAAEAALEGHVKVVDALCMVEFRGQQLLASGSLDKTIRLWDPSTGECVRVVTSPDYTGGPLCAVVVGGRQLLASTGPGRKDVIVWDLLTQECVLRLVGPGGNIQNLCPVPEAGRPLLAGRDDESLMVWDMSTGDVVVTAPDVGPGKMCPLWSGNRFLLAMYRETTQRDVKTLVLLDPLTGETVRGFGSASQVRSMCPLRIDGQSALVTLTGSRSMVAWRPDGRLRLPPIVLAQSNAPAAACVVPHGRRDLLAVADGWAVNLYDVDELRENSRTPVQWARTARIRAICSLRVTDREVLVGARDSKGPRVVFRDYGDGGDVSTTNPPIVGINAMSRLPMEGRDVLALAGRLPLMAAVRGRGGRGLWEKARALFIGGRICLWDPEAGREVKLLDGRDGVISALCDVVVEGRILLAAAGKSSVTLWDPGAGEPVRAWPRRGTAPTHLCVLRLGGQDLLAGGSGTTVCFWNSGTGEAVRTATVPTGGIDAMATVRLGGADLLAIVDNDRTVRIRDPRTMNCLLTIPNYRPIRTVAQVGGLLAIGMDAGVMSLRLTL
ncbi:WD40 repeat domain-containing protein [Streptomyces massasporeus]